MTLSLFLTSVQMNRTNRVRFTAPAQKGGSLLAAERQSALDELMIGYFSQGGRTLEFFEFLGFCLMAGRIICHFRLPGALTDLFW